MKLYICANGFNEDQLKQAKGCLLELQKKHQCSMSEELAAKLDPDHNSTCFEVKDCDLIVSLGGDGALLAAAQTAIREDKPLVGINAGRVGYLCAMKFEDIAEFDERLSSCKKVDCTLLEVEHEGETYYALNDVIVSKTNFGKTVDLSVFAEEEKLFHVRGDGVIVSTPTGSTAYNRTAGGPFIDEDVPALGITAICSIEVKSPHVVSDDKKVTVRVDHEDAGIYADSRFLGTYNDELQIKKADKTLTLYK